MRFKLKDVIDQHKNIPAAICLHGPSLNEQKEEIEKLHKNKRLIKFCVSDWFNFFESSPDYWILANGELNVEDLVEKRGTWLKFNTPSDILDKQNIKLFYASSIDNTDVSWVENNLKLDFCPYDQRHFKGHSCLEIMSNFKKHYEKEKNFNFKEYGNNENLFTKFSQEKAIKMGVHPTYAKFGAGFGGVFNRRLCCNGRIDEKTIQETLQEVSGHEQHFGTADSVAFHAIAIAIIMGCNPIYVTGMDLDYNKGYGENNKNLINFINGNALNHWQFLESNILSDLKIINESAIKRGIQVINLTKDAWYKTFKQGEITL